MRLKVLGFQQRGNDRATLLADEGRASASWDSQLSLYQMLTESPVLKEKRAPQDQHHQAATDMMFSSEVA